MINIIYHVPKKEYLDALSSNDILLSFFNIQLERYKNGGIDDLISNIILLLGNVMYRKKDKIIEI